MNIYICTGSVRGECNGHDTLTKALQCLQRDAEGCASQGGYSDRFIRRIDNRDINTVDELEIIDEWFETRYQPGRDD